MRDWLKKITGRKKSPYGVGRGGVDAGGSAFVRLNERESRQKKNLLKKLNLHWSRKKDQDVPYQSKPGSGIWRRVLLPACLLAALALFFQSGGFSLVGSLFDDIDYFRITSIQVRGSVNSSADQIRNATGVQISSGLLSIDLQGVAAAVKKENGWVKDVTVSRHWPDTLVLQVDEYEPYALIAVGAEDRAKLQYLDRSGIPFARTSFGLDLDFPVITGLEEQADEQRRAGYLEQPLHLLRLIGANNPNLPIQSISEIHIDDQEGLVIYLVEHPFPIFFGEGDIRQKYVRLRKVLEMLYKQRKTGMDIGRVAYIRMDYLDDKVIVGYSES